MEAGQVLLFTGGVSCGSAAVYVRLLLCGSIAAFYVWCTPDMRFRCGVLHLVHVRYTVLLRRFMFGVRPICGSVVAFCTWFTSGIRFYCGVLCSITPAVCLLTNRTACGMLRSYTAGSRSPFARSRDVGAVICLCGFTSGWPFVCGDLDGATGDAGNGAGGAALVRFCAIALALKCFPLGVRWGLRAPKPAPKSLRLSGLSSRCGGVVLVQICGLTKSASAPISAPTRAKPGYMERPVRL